MLSVPEAAERIGVSPQAVRKKVLRMSGYGPGRGGRWALEDELLEILDSAEARAKRTLDRLSTVIAKLDQRGFRHVYQRPVPTVSDLPSIQRLARIAMEEALMSLISDWVGRCLLDTGVAGVTCGGSPDQPAIGLESILRLYDSGLEPGSDAWQELEDTERRRFEDESSTAYQRTMSHQRALSPWDTP